jgi:hypothetical protein
MQELARIAQLLLQSLGRLPVFALQSGARAANLEKILRSAESPGGLLL